MLHRFLSNRRMEGEPIHVGEITLTPVSQALVLQLPGGLGGFTWNRPAGVRVAQTGQDPQFLPVRDITRMTILVMFGAMFGTFMFAWLLRRR